jgi:hypothetical protein
MRNNYALLEAGVLPGNIRAFNKNAVGKIQYYDVAAAIEDVGDAIGDAFDSVGDVLKDAGDAIGDALKDVGDAVGDVVRSAIDNPIQTIVTIAAVAMAPATGGASLYAIPATSAATVLANGGDFDDALKAAAISYVSTSAGNMAGNYVGSQMGSAAAANTAARSAVMQQLAAGATRAAVSGATSAALTGRDVGDAVVRSLAGYGLYRGVDYAFNEAGQAIDAVTGHVLANADGTLSNVLTGVDDVNAVDLTNYADEVGVNIDAFGRALGETNPYATPIEEVSSFQPSEYDLAPVDYGLVPRAAVTSGYQEGDLGAGLKAPEVPYQNYDPLAGPIDYGLFPEGTDFGTGQGLKAPGSPNLATMGGGQGLTAPYVGDGSVPILGDPESFLNDPNVLGTGVMQQGSPEEDPVVKAAKDYFSRQVKGQLTSNLMGDIFDTGAPKAPANALRYGRRSYLPAGMEDVSGTTVSSLFSAPQDTVEETTEEATALSETDPNVDFGSSLLFNPMGDASWAPQTKIGGLGFAGKFINRDSDTYYVSKEQEDRDKARQKLQSQQGWLTDEERQQLVKQAGDQDSPYYDFNLSNYDLSTPGTASYAEGGPIGHNPEFYSEGGASIGNRYVKGDGDGTSDSVPAMLASGEFVIPADVVSGLGNGDNDAGAMVLDEFMEIIRHHKRNAKPNELPPDSKGPLSYLDEALSKSNRKRK